MGVIRM